MDKTTRHELCYGCTPEIYPPALTVSRSRSRTPAQECPHSRPLPSSLRLPDGLVQDQQDLLRLWLPVEAGNIIVFPSSLRHSVQEVKDDTVRVSLAFNSMLTGFVGRDQDLSSVHL